LGKGLVMNQKTFFDSINIRKPLARLHQKSYGRNKHDVLPSIGIKITACFLHLLVIDTAVPWDSDYFRVREYIDNIKGTAFSEISIDAKSMTLFVLQIEITMNGVLFADKQHSLQPCPINSERPLLPDLFNAKKPNEVVG